MTKGKCKEEEKQNMKMFINRVTSCDFNFRLPLHWSQTTKMVAHKSSTRYVWTAEETPMIRKLVLETKISAILDGNKRQRVTRAPPLSSALV